RRPRRSPSSPTWKASPPRSTACGRRPRRRDRTPVSEANVREPRPADGVDVVVPVHGAAADLARCVASVRRHTDLARHRLLVVLDGPQAADVEAVVGTLADLATDACAVLRLQARRGF